MLNRSRYILLFCMVLFSALPAAAQLLMPDNVCIGTTKHYTVDPNPFPGSTYTWRIDGVAQLSTINEIDIIWNTEGTYLLDVQELSKDGCLGPLRSGQVFVSPLPAINAGPDATILAGASYSLSESSVTGTGSLIWTSSGTGSFDNPEALHPIYTPGSGDIILGSVTLTLTLIPSGPCLAIDDSLVLTINHPDSGILITKRALETNFSAVGDVIHYSIDVFNTSDENAYNIAVTDPNAIITSASPIGIIDPGNKATVTAVHIVIQTDLDAGKVLNTAYLNSSDSEGASAIDTSNTVILYGLQRSQLTITKFATETTFHSVGEIIHYSFEVFNCGNVTVTNIITTDPDAIIIQGSPIVSLAPRNTAIATGEHVITQTDIDAGKITNIAFASGIDPKGKPVSDESNAVTLFANQPAQLVISKIALETSFSAIGDTIHYLMAVRNFRTTTMSDIVVSDPNATVTSGSPIFRLASGSTTIVAAAHVITQKDMDEGKVINVAIARGKDFYDFIDKATSNEVTVFARQSPNLILTKTAEESSYNAVGDLIHYTNEITNNGNVIITGITLTDPNTSMTGSNRVAGLSPGESVTVKTTHTISQADLNIGFVEKTATVTGFDPNSSMIHINSNQLIIKGHQQARMTTDLTAAETSYSLPGDVIHYSVEIRNTGNVTLTNIRLTDLNALFIKGNSILSMVPGATAMVTAEHLIIQTDLLAGKLIGSVTVSGYQPGGEQITSMSNELAIQANKAEGLTVTEVVQESAYGKVGEAIHYIITVENHGKVPVFNITASDPNAVISGNPNIASLMASGSATMAAIHMVTQSDLDAGLISNNASITGTYPDGTTFNEQGNQVVIYALKNPQLTIRFSATETSFKAVGDQINYTIEVGNTGNLSVSDIVLHSQGDLMISGSPVLNLAPGNTAGLSAIYTITVADLDAGKVVMAVSASGKDPDKQPVSVTGDEVLIMGLQNPELSTIAAAVETFYSQVGEVIHYNIQVKNSGNVSLVSTAVTDPNAVIITVRPNTILFPGESFMVSASHIITQADLDAGKVVSVATSAGFDLKGNTIEAKGNAVIIIALQRIELTLSNMASQSIFKKVGEIINYNLEIRNSGNVTLFTIAITDPNLLLNTSVPIASLIPGEAVSVSASHTITQADLDAGEVVSIAKAAGINLNGKRIENTGNKVTVIGEQCPELVATTAASVSFYKKEGDLIVYTVVVKNTGNVTMSNIYMTDAKVLLDFSRPITTLAPGESDSVTAEHRVTADDINNGTIITTGIAHGSTLTAQSFSYLSNEVFVHLMIENYNLSNFPNPFAYETTIVFDLPEKGEVILKVYNIAGMEVGQICNQKFNRGRNFVNWKTLGTQKGSYILKMYYNGGQAVRVISVIN